MLRSGLADYFRSHPHPGGIIVDPQRKFIYMKSAKTAGTSILRHLLEEKIAGIIHRKDHPEEFAAWLRDVTDEALADYYIFAVIRNPWDRAVSSAAYLNIPLELYLDEFDRHVLDKKVRIHSMPQILYTHMSGAAFVDKICRFENLQTDINEVLGRLGLQQWKIPHSNKSRHRHYTFALTEDQADRVRDIYPYDTTVYGYSFKAETRWWPRLMRLATSAQ